MKLIFSKFLARLPVIFAVYLSSVSLIYLVPGDPVDLILGEQALSADRSELRSSLGLDLSFGERLIKSSIGFFSFDLGHSLYSKEPVKNILLDRLSATFELAFSAWLVALVFGIILGLICVRFKGQLLDRFIYSASLLGLSLPGVFLGPLLIWIFALGLNLFPVSERGGLGHLALPAFSLVIPLASVMLRITRASLLESLYSDYIRTARSKGLSEWKILSRHALSNALLPVITISGLQIGALLTGTVITETIFDWPGLGSLIYSAISSRDYPLLQGALFCVSSIYVFVNFLTDIAYTFANPKVRVSSL